jgi:hypothetical protein
MAAPTAPIAAAGPEFNVARSISPPPRSPEVDAKKAEASLANVDQVSQHSPPL